MKSIAPLTGAIFDLDGTLLDSMSMWWNLGENCLRALGKAPRPNLREALKPLTLIEAAVYFQEEYNVTADVSEILHLVHQILKDGYAYEIQPKPGALAFLRRLRVAGVKLAVATATERPLVDAALSRCGILKYLDFSITCTEAGADKTSPKIYQVARNALGTPLSSTWVFEDALYAIRTAKAAGFPVAAIYEPVLERDWDDACRLADRCLHSFEEASVSFSKSDSLR